MSELDRNGKCKGFRENCVIKMAHIVDILHRVILVERHNAEVVCRAHWASVETGIPQRHNFNNILAWILLSLFNRQLGKEQIDTMPLTKR